MDVTTLCELEISILHLFIQLAICIDELINNYVLSCCSVCLLQPLADLSIVLEHGLKELLEQSFCGKLLVD